METMNVNVLGTEYEIAFVPEWEDEKLSDCSGYIDPTIRRIVVASRFGEHPRNVKDLSSFTMDNLRHELVHAFFKESGLWGDSDLGQNELLVGWVALQLPKMAKAMRETGCLEV